MPLLGNGILRTDGHQGHIRFLPRWVVRKPRIGGRQNHDVAGFLSNFGVAIGLLQIPLAPLERRHHHRLAILGEDTVL